MVSHDGQLNHSSSIGLKTVFGESPTCSRGALEFSSSVCKGTISRFRRTVGWQGSVGEQWRDTFIRGDLPSPVSVTLRLRRSSIQKALLPQLTSTLRLTVCNCSTATAAFQQMDCSQGFFAKLMDSLSV